MLEVKAIVDSEGVEKMASAPAFAASWVHVNFCQSLGSSEVSIDAMPRDSTAFPLAHHVLRFQKNPNKSVKSHCTFAVDLEDWRRCSTEICRGGVVRQRFTPLGDARQARLTSVEVYALCRHFGLRQATATSASLLRYRYIPHSTTSPSFPRQYFAATSIMMR